jgi:hypothetical protein
MVSLLPALCWFLAWLILQPWRWKQHVPQKHWLSFNGIHGIISQKTELFITTASNHTYLNSDFYVPKVTKDLEIISGAISFTYSISILYTELILKYFTSRNSAYKPCINYVIKDHLKYFSDQHQHIWQASLNNNLVFHLDQFNNPIQIFPVLSTFWTIKPYIYMHICPLHTFPFPPILVPEIWISLVSLFWQ